MADQNIICSTTMRNANDRATTLLALLAFVVVICFFWKFRYLVGYPISNKVKVYLYLCVSFTVFLIFFSVVWLSVFLNIFLCPTTLRVPFQIVNHKKFSIICDLITIHLTLIQRSFTFYTWLVSACMHIILSRENCCKLGQSALSIARFTYLFFLAREI